MDRPLGMLQGNLPPKMPPRLVLVAPAVKKSKSPSITAAIQPRRVLVAPAATRTTSHSIAQNKQAADGDNQADVGVLAGEQPAARAPHPKQDIRQNLAVPGGKPLLVGTNPPPKRKFFRQQVLGQYQRTNGGNQVDVGVLAGKQPADKQDPPAARAQPPKQYTQQSPSDGKPPSLSHDYQAARTFYPKTVIRQSPDVVPGKQPVDAPIPPVARAQHPKKLNNRERPTKRYDISGKKHTYIGRLKRLDDDQIKLINFWQFVKWPKNDKNVYNPHIFLIHNPKMTQKRHLNEGAFGKVACFSSTNYPQKEFAVKKIKVPGLSSDKMGLLQSDDEIMMYNRLIMREFSMAPEINLPGCVRSYGWYVEKVAKSKSNELNACLVMKYYKGGDLRKKMEGGPLEEREIQQFILDIGQTLCDLHTEYGIMHRDIKPENILIDEFGRFKIADVGLSVKDRMNRRHSIGEGTAEYMDPEQSKSSGYDSGVDYWSLGVILHEMLTGQNIIGINYTMDSARAMHAKLTDTYVIDTAKQNLDKHFNQLDPKDWRQKYKPLVQYFLRIPDSGFLEGFKKNAEVKNDLSKIRKKLEKVFNDPFLQVKFDRYDEQKKQSGENPFKQERCLRLDNQ